MGKRAKAFPSFPGVKIDGYSIENIFRDFLFSITGRMGERLEQTIVSGLERADQDSTGDLQLQPSQHGKPK